MDLPVMPPVKPMLAKSVKGVPAADSVDGGLSYEPKWDGFRCIVFRDGDEIVLASRSTKELTRYFPDVVEAVRAHTPERCVLDGEIFLAIDGRLEFDALSQRIHPAASRVAMLAEQTPASFVAFDLLAIGDESLMDEPFSVRRSRLEAALSTSSPPIHLTRTTTDADVAQEWFGIFEGAGLDGVVAKALGKPYAPNGRQMLKIKHARTADVVVAGYRLHKTSTDERPLLGSLLLGLYTPDGALQHVGVAASFTDTNRAKLVELLQPLVVDTSDHPWGQWQDVDAQASSRLPGGQSRWSGTKDLSFVTLDPTLVAEVGYEHMEGDRFRHMAQFKRWRPDREPESCTYEQLEEVVSYDLGDVLL
ncbi:ATP-dependent DNA ligase [Aeromicrobium fastidiosum]|uniref:ATP-dependent DNA ligase n=1 Tax=Aeromicrobium fastidiosum TaxID=52699 RepID=UPI0020233F02|nr:ATP-dependent DNA ligase [Aeromicrobium fastidiosum]MCL8250744.1 ATP-dependent DNA ligase [Aeromicrobium fastidiosum]